jgi:hypothetical protein
LGQGWLDAGAGVGVEVTPGDELVGQAPGLVAGPGLKGGDKRVLVGHAVLERDQSEEEVAVASAMACRAPVCDSRSAR